MLEAFQTLREHRQYANLSNCEGLDVRLDLSYEEEVVQILDYSLRTLCCREVPLVKVLCSKQGVEETTWECDNDMRVHFPDSSLQMVMAQSSSFFPVVLATISLACVTSLANSGDIIL